MATVYRITCECGEDLCDVLSAGEDSGRQSLSIVASCPFCDDDTLPRTLPSAVSVLFAGLDPRGGRSARPATQVYASRTKTGWHVRVTKH